MKFQDSVPAAVVGMKVGVDDDVNVLRGEAQAVQIPHQAILANEAPNLPFFGRELVAEAGVHQYLLALGFDE